VSRTANTKADLRGCINVLLQCLRSSRRKCKRLEAENERLKERVKEPRQGELELRI